MKALIKMLHNTEANTYHPIFYIESPLPGAGNSITRYKSKGHRAEGFKERQDAMEAVQTEIIERLPADIYTVVGELDLEQDLIWDGKEVPGDVQIR